MIGLKLSYVRRNRRLKSVASVAQPIQTFLKIARHECQNLSLCST